MAINPTKALYCPETIPGARVLNLAANTPYAVESISRFSKVPGEYLVRLRTFGLGNDTTVTFYTNTDGTFRIIDSQSYACYSLARDEDVFVDAKTTLGLSLLASGIVNNYPIRYTVEVIKPSVLDKLLYGISLNENDLPINNMFSLGDMIKAGEYPFRTPLLVSRRQVARTITAAASTQQIGETIDVPKDRYIVLDEIVVDGYEAGVTDNFIRVDRDLDESYVSLNCYAMPPFVYGTVPGTLTPDISLSYPMKIGIPAVDKISVYLVSGSGVTDWRVRYKYSIYVMTVADKIRWNLPLTSKDEDIAKKRDLYNKVKAGLV
jgi:hypothetical protein